MVLLGPLGAAAGASPLQLTGINVPAGANTIYRAQSLVVDGNITIGRGATLTLDAVDLLLSAPNARVSLAEGAQLRIVNRSNLTSSWSGGQSYALSLASGSQLATDRAVLAGWATFSALDATLRFNLTTLGDAPSSILLGGDSHLLAENSSFANITPVSIEVGGNASAEVRGLAVPSYRVAAGGRFAYATYTAVRVLDTSGKALTGADWRVETEGRTVAASPGLGGHDPFTQLDHQGYPAPLWVPVVQFEDAGSGVLRPASTAFAAYGSWNESRAVDTSAVSEVVFSASPRGFALEDKSAEAVLDAGRAWLVGDPHMSQGPGSAWADFNLDGIVDVVVTAAPEADAIALEARGINAEQAPAPALFLGSGNGSFRQAGYTGFEDARGATGVSVADFDSDGDPDLFVARYGTVGSLSLNATTGGFDLTDGVGLGADLYRNVRGEFFEKATAQAQLALSGRHTVGGAWGDFDGDGCIDLYVINMGEILMPPAPAGGGTASAFADNLIKNESNALWRNNCNGTFADVTSPAGHVTGGGAPGETGVVQRLVRVPEEQYFVGNQSGLSPEGSGISYAALWLDTDEDGDLDLLVADDFGASPLYRNDGDGTFSLHTTEAGLLRVGSAMSFTAADFDRDGDLDIFQPNFNRDFLWINRGDGTFVDDAEAWGVAELAVGWGARASDLNLDGFPDLAVATGAMSMGFKAAERSVVYFNDAGKRFWEVSSTSGFDGPGTAISLTSADANRDGRDDLLLGRINASNSFYLNGEVGGGFVQLSLRGVLSPTFGEGAEVRAVIGGRPYRAAFAPAGEYASSSEPLLTIGLGGASAAERVTVYWPSGSAQRVGTLAAGTRSTVFEGTTVQMDAGPDRVANASEPVHLAWSLSGPAGPGTTFRARAYGYEATYDWGMNLRDPWFSPEVPGTYVATLELRDRYGRMLAQDKVLIKIVDNVKPGVQASVLGVDAKSRTVHLSANGTTDNDPTFAESGSIRWTFSKGSETVEAVGWTPNVMLPSAGVWSLRVVATDAAGNPTSATQSVTVPALTESVAPGYALALLDIAVAAAALLGISRTAPRAEASAPTSRADPLPRPSPDRASRKAKR